jgi:hypothetical protein
MSQENVEIVRRFTDAVNNADRTAVAELIDPEVEWRTGPEIGRYGAESGVWCRRQMPGRLALAPRRH